MKQVEDESSIPSEVTVATRKDDTSIPSEVTVGTHGGIPLVVTVPGTQQIVAPSIPSEVTVGILLPPKGVEGPQSSIPSEVTVDDATAERGSHAKISFMKHGNVVTKDGLPPPADLRNESTTSGAVSGHPVNDPNVQDPRSNDEIPPSGTDDIGDRHTQDDDDRHVHPRISSPAPLPVKFPKGYDKS